MIAVTGHFDDGFNYLPDNYLEFLTFDCQSILATLEEYDYEWSEGVDINIALNRASYSDLSIYAPAYQNRELCIRFFKSETEALELSKDDDEAPQLMSLTNFKQISCNAAIQLCLRILNFIEIEDNFENEVEEDELYKLDDFDQAIKETDMCLEKASYLAILKSELDRCFLNILMADKNHQAILQWKSREKLKKAHQKGAEATKMKWEGARKLSIAEANKAWKKNNGATIQSTAKAILKLMDSPELCTKHNIVDAPELSTIKNWIKEVAPASVRKPGRPAKPKP